MSVGVKSIQQVPIQFISRRHSSNSIGSLVGIPVRLPQPTDGSSRKYDINKTKTMSKLDIQAFSLSADDPFSQTSLTGGNLDLGKVHLLIQQRNGRKCGSWLQVRALGPA